MIRIRVSGLLIWKLSHYNVLQTEVTLLGACHKVDKLVKIVVSVDLSRTNGVSKFDES